jgi:hypothetical protein
MAIFDWYEALPLLEHNVDVGAKNNDGPLPQASFYPLFL